MSIPAPAIELEHVSVVRGTKAVVLDVSLGIAAGTVTGLLGPSGCGKTTLIRAIVGAQRKVSGTVRVLGEPAGVKTLRGRVGYMTQASAIYGDLTVAANLAYFGAVLRAPEGAAARVLKEVDLESYARQRVDRLSGGQRARVSLASALLNNPPVLLLDEPTVGLDPVLRRELWGLFSRLAAAGATLLVSSHVMDEAERCDNLVLMREGRILATGTPAGLVASVGARDVEGAFLQLVQPGGVP